MLTVKPNKLQWYSFGITMILMGGCLFFGILWESYRGNVSCGPGWVGGVFLGGGFALILLGIVAIVSCSKVSLQCDGTRLIYHGFWNTRTFLFEQITQITWPDGYKGAIILETETGRFTITLLWWNRRDGCFGAVILALHKAVLPEKQKNWREFCHIVEDNPENWPRTLGTPTPDPARHEKLVTRDRYNRHLRWMIPVCAILSIVSCAVVYCLKGTVFVADDEVWILCFTFATISFLPVFAILIEKLSIPRDGKIVQTKRPKLQGRSPSPQYVTVSLFLIFVLLLFMLIFDVFSPEVGQWLAVLTLIYMISCVIFIGFYAVNYQKRAIQRQAAELPEGFIPKAFQLKKIDE